jgi:hypothetical protein
MKRSPLPEDADHLLAVGEAVAAVLSEKRDELGMSIEVEALLRASIAAATFSINAYIGVLAGARKSPVALSHLAAARSRCDRNIRQLRRRVMRSIGELYRHVSDRDLTGTAEYVKP